MFEVCLEPFSQLMIAPMVLQDIGSVILVSVLWTVHFTHCLISNNQKITWKTICGISMVCNLDCTCWFSNIFAQNRCHCHITTGMRNYNRSDIIYSYWVHKVMDYTVCCCRCCSPLSISYRWVLIRRICCLCYLRYCDSHAGSTLLFRNRLMSCTNWYQMYHNGLIRYERIWMLKQLDR